MGIAARKELPGRPHTSSVSWSLFEQLTKAHELLRQEMQTVDSMTREARPSDGPFTNARWQISQASLRKRALVAKIVDYLIGQLDHEATLSLKAVRTADQQLLRRSASHVRFWSSRAIRQNWEGYCDASRDIRRHMSAQILLEQQTIPPLLLQMADREGRA